LLLGGWLCAAALVMAIGDIDVAFCGGLTAIVGVSGSGKSSLAFDVVYHEARRRLLDSLSLS
jgi:excinuclease ABC subunit A